MNAYEKSQKMHAMDRALQLAMSIAGEAKQLTSTVRGTDGLGGHSLGWDDASDFGLAQLEATSAAVLAWARHYHAKLVKELKQEQ